MLTRRTFNRLLPVGLAVAAYPSFAISQEAEPSSVRLGLETYSLFPLPRPGLQDRWIALMKQVGLTECNLFEPLLQPDDITARLRKAREAKDQAAIQAANQDMSQWRAGVPVTFYSDMRKKFNAAGIRFAIYTAGTNAASTDAELERACVTTQALGADTISIAAGKLVLKRIIPLVERYDLRLGIMGHPAADSTDPDAVCRPADYEEAVQYSPRFGIEIDIGDATGAGFDVMAFVRKNHTRISRIELKDRKRDATSMPWGQGDTPVRDVLLYVRDQHLPIRCYIDCDYLPATEERIASIQACRGYIRSTLGI